MNGKLSKGPHSILILLLLLSSTPLVFAADDHGNTAGTATLILLNGGGAGNAVGGIELSGDVDFFQFLATVSGAVTVQMDAAGASALDSVLSAFDNSLVSLGVNDDFGATLNSRVVFTVTAGQTYFLQAAGFGASIGAYTLAISTTTDDFGNTIAAAQNLVLTALGAGQVAGAIEVTGDVDLFQVVAPITGTLTLQLDAPGGSLLDPRLTVFDNGGALIDQNNNGGAGTLSSLLPIAVTTGNTYFLQVSGFNNSTGAYLLTIVPDSEFLLLRRAAIRLDFSTSGLDRIQVRGTLAIPNGFMFDGAVVRTDVGGVSKTFVLDSRGRGQAGGDKLRISPPRNGLASFSLKRVRGNFQAPLLASANLDNADADGEIRVLTVTIVLGDIVYRVDRAVLYFARQDLLGKTR